MLIYQYLHKISKGTHPIAIPGEVLLYSSDLMDRILQELTPSAIPGSDEVKQKSVFVNWRNKMKTNKTLNLLMRIGIFIFLIGLVGEQKEIVQAGINRTVQEVHGIISVDTDWFGEILVTDTVVVLPNVTLHIHPGTKVRFVHYRGYREPERKLSLIINGRIIANGTDADPIYFTSDAPEPQNGDWSMIRLISNTAQSEFNWCVFEFAQHGLNVWNSSPFLSHIIFRWNNWEGVYFESYSAPTIVWCQIYENGYNGLAAEQLNTISMDYCEVWRNGTCGVHIDNSTAEIHRSIIHDNNAHGLSVDNGSTLNAFGDEIYDNTACGIGFGEGTNTVSVSNNSIYDNGGGGNICGPVTSVTTSFFPPSSIDIGFTPDMSYELGYIPGDPNLDQYLYVYPDDETRLIVRKIGTGLGLTWSVAYHNSSIWTSTLQGNVYQLNPNNGTVLSSFTLSGSPTWGTPTQPWGMAFDDEGFMWIVDFAERKLFKINISTQQIVFSVDTPNATAGGCKGLAWDGEYLNVLGWVTPTIYKVTKQGVLVESIPLDHGGTGGLAWDGQFYWVPTKGRILKYDSSGKQVGWIYAASEGTWDMAWADGFLWATQRTNENWMDEKIFQLEILNDHDYLNKTYIPLLVR